MLVRNNAEFQSLSAHYHPLRRTVDVIAFRVFYAFDLTAMIPIPRTLAAFNRNIHDNQYCVSNIWPIAIGSECISVTVATGCLFSILLGVVCVDLHVLFNDDFTLDCPSKPDHNL